MSKQKPSSPFLSSMSNNGTPHSVGPIEPLQGTGKDRIANGGSDSDSKRLLLGDQLEGESSGLD